MMQGSTDTHSRATTFDLWHSTTRLKRSHGCRIHFRRVCFGDCDPQGQGGHGCHAQRCVVPRGEAKRCAEGQRRAPLTLSCWQWIGIGDLFRCVCCAGGVIMGEWVKARRILSGAIRHNSFSPAWAGRSFDQIIVWRRCSQPRASPRRRGGGGSRSNGARARSR
jgi:hypothetical protein